MSDLCAAGDRCLDFDRQEGRPGYAEDGPLCEGCLLAGERAVPALVLDYRDLEQQLPKPLSSWGDGQPGGSAESPSLLRLDVEAHQRAIWWVLMAWEDVLRDLENLSDPSPKVYAHWSAAPPKQVQGVEVQRAAGILAVRVRRMARLEPFGFWAYPPAEGWVEVSGAEGVLDLVELHRQAQRMLGLTPARPELCDGVPCRDCDTKTLYRVAGSADVECLTCRLRLTEAEYKRWVGIVAAATQRDLEEFEMVPGDR